MSKKQKAKQAPAPVKVTIPVFLYTSVCHQAPAKKGACEMATGIGVKAFGEKPEGEASLRSWRCTTCNRPCKVTRSLNPDAKCQSQLKS
jgi:hypothetical protein